MRKKEEEGRGMRGKKIFKNEEVHFIKGFANLAKIEVSKYYAEYTIFNNGIFPAPKTKSLINPLVLRVEFLHFVSWPAPKTKESEKNLMGLL